MCANIKVYVCAVSMLVYFLLSCASVNSLHAGVNLASDNN